MFTNEPMDPITQEEEGFHWLDESTAGPFVPVWYTCYLIESAVNYIAYGFDAHLAHNTVSFERAAMGYADGLT